MQQIYFYSLMFVMGVISSVTIMLLLIQFLPIARNTPNYLSNVHYLQVRDDFSLYSLSSDRFKNTADQYDTVGQKRSTVEGRASFIWNFRIEIEVII